MTEGEPRIPFELLRATQEGLEQHGYYFLPVEREHTEGLVTEPLTHRLRTLIKKRSFGKVAGRTILTFSGYETDQREIYEVPEIRAYFRTLDRQLPELPALPAFLPQLRFNGPGLYLLLLGEIDETIPHPEQRYYDVHVVGADRIREQALARIRQAASRYHLNPLETNRLLTNFQAGASHRPY